MSRLGLKVYGFNEPAAKKLQQIMRERDGFPAETSRLTAFLNTGVRVADQPYLRWFKLTAQVINTGSAANADWLRYDADTGSLQADGETGQVLDRIGRFWGIEDEVGAAYPLDNGTTRVMQIGVNPGRNIYEGTVASGSSIPVGGSGSVETVLTGTHTVTVHDPGYLPATVPAAAVLRYYFNLKTSRFEILDLKDCPS